MKVRVGIDIGSDGAYAVFTDGKLSHYGVFPYVSEELDVRALCEEIEKPLVETCDDWHFVIEDLHSVFNSSASSNFTFGANNGMIWAMLKMLGLPYTKVAPKKWQKQMWEGIRPVMKKDGDKKDKEGLQKYKVDTKATSLVAAQRLFPGEKFLANSRCRTPHDGIVDAVLIASYCSRNF